MPGSALGSILVSGLAGFITGYVVLWLARGSWVARLSVGVLTVTCFIASGIIVKMAFQAAHSESLGGPILLRCRHLRCGSWDGPTGLHIPARAKTPTVVGAVGGHS